MDTKHFQTTMFQVTSFMALMNSALLILPEPSWVLATLPWGSLGANFTDAKICQVSVSRALKSDRNSSTCFKSFFLSSDGLRWARCFVCVSDDLCSAPCGTSLMISKMAEFAGQESGVSGRDVINAKSHMLPSCYLHFVN